MTAIPAPMATSTRHQDTGCRAPAPAVAVGNPHAGALCYLPASGAVVVLMDPVTAGWVCAVITDPRRGHRRGTIVELCDGDIRSALPVDLADPTIALPAGEFARVWLARIWGDTRGGRLYQVARVLAHQVRDPGTRTVLINDAVQGRLATAAHLRPQGLQRILARLQSNNLLTPVGGYLPDTCVLTLPALRIPNPPTRKAGP